MGGADADGGGQCMFFAGIPGLSTDGSVGLVGACVPSERFNVWPETATAQCCGPQSSHVQRRLEDGDAGAVEDGAVIGVVKTHSDSTVPAYCPVPESTHCPDGSMPICENTCPEYPEFADDGHGCGYVGYIAGGWPWRVVSRAERRQGCRAGSLQSLAQPPRCRSGAQFELGDDARLSNSHRFLLVSYSR